MKIKVAHHHDQLLYSVGMLCHKYHLRLLLMSKSNDRFASCEGRKVAVEGAPTLDRFLFDICVLFGSHRAETYMW